MIWSPTRRFCFVHISKTGGTSIEAAYIPHVQFGDVILSALPEGMDTWYRQYLRVGKHGWARRIRLLVGRAQFERMLSVAVVRDPLDRMLSYYRWIHTGPHEGEQERELAKLVDFEPFVAEVARLLPSQAEMVTDARTGEVIVKHLIPFRRLAEGWAGVAARLGIEAPLPHVNASSARVQVNVTDRARALVLENFARDAELVAAVERNFVPLAAEQAAHVAPAAK